MNTFNFSIRLAMYPEANLSPLYVDELPREYRVSILSYLSGEYDWLDETEGEEKGSKEYLIQQNLMAQDGFTNDDITMLSEYQDDGKLHISIMSDKDFNEVREVPRYFTSRTLLDCVKNSINGHLSDGIGENEVGRCQYNGVVYNVWLDKLETDAETVKDGKYFKVNSMRNNIFERAYFGKPFMTRDGRKAVYLGGTMCWIEGRDCETEYSRSGLFGEGEHSCDIISEWKESIGEKEYEEKFKSLYESCVYWQAYEDEPELFAKAFKELLEFAPNDKRTIDYCSDMIKSRETIFNEVNEAITPFIKTKEIDESELEKLADISLGKRLDEYGNVGTSEDAYKYGFKDAYENL